MEDQETTQTYQSSPNKDTSFMLYRLNTEHLIHQLRITLSGKKEEIYETSDGHIQARETVIAAPLLNEAGVNYILNWFKGIVNSSTVQANLKEDVFWNTVAGYREQIAEFLYINFNLWEVKEHNFDLIVESTLNTIRLFITRTIDNKERESYSDTYKETISQNIGGKYKL